MDRSRVRELHYITHIINVGSILDRGILSHREAKRQVRSHVAIADTGVQKRRAVKRVPIGGSSRALHDYANLYIHARNAMLRRLLSSHGGELIVLAVDPKVLDLPDVVVADRNAATAIVRFEPAGVGIDGLDEAAVFAEWWNHSQDAMQRRMAEVLVPGRIPPEFILGAYVADESARRRLLDQLGGRELRIRVDGWLFFNRSDG